MNRMKCTAVLVVTMMLAVTSVPLIEDADPDLFSGLFGFQTDAATENYWTYTISCDSSFNVTVAGSGYDRNGKQIPSTPTAYSKSRGVGSWGFDSDGYGPFGSFYAAFDASDGNRMLCILNPDDLSESIEGKSLSDYGDGEKNIMWVLPTIYWKADSSGILTLTNDPNAGGTAYAHTVGAETYGYMAIGVYEASTSTTAVTDETILMSSTGKSPVSYEMISTMRGYAVGQTVATQGEQDGHAMLWNFYMWQLYRFSVIAVGGGLQSQGIFGNGDVAGENYQKETTGRLDQSGPYAGTLGNANSTSSDSYHSAPVKAFIEDAWGSLAESVDGCLFYDGVLHITQDYEFTSSADNTDGTGKWNMDKSDFYASGEQISLPVKSGYYTDLYTTSAVAWGIPTSSSETTSSSSGAATKDYFDAATGTSSNPYNLKVGGYSNTATDQSKYGLSYMNLTTKPITKAMFGTTRLAFVFNSDSDEDDSIDVKSGCWGYRITPDAQVTGYGTAVQSPVAAGNAGTDGSYVSSNGEHVGTWRFDSDGYGPFGSFYAAFDASKNNKMLCILDPNNLQYSVTGRPLSDYGSGAKNIMWVLPTVYWLTDSDGSLFITNDASAGGTAYAHTVNGTVYPYLAIGVYEATSSTTAVSGKTILTSESGTSPVNNVTRSVLRGYANSQSVDISAGENTDGTTGHAMLWNFYQYELYKYCALAVMGSWDSQSVIGNGYSYSGSNTNYYKNTGLSDSSGPYAGTIGSELSACRTGVKMFVENPWGSLYTLVDGIVIDNSGNMYIDQSAIPTDSKTAGDSITVVAQTDLGQGWVSSPSASAQIWGMPTAVSGSATSGLFDYCHVSSSESGRWLAIGQCARSSESEASMAGISGLCLQDINHTYISIGSRLAFVFDGDPVTEATAQVTSVADVGHTVGSATVVEQNITVRLEIPSASVSQKGTLSLDGVYWITTSDGIRAYGDLCSLALGSRTVDEKGEGILRITATFVMPDADHRIYNVYAKYVSADGSYTAVSPVVFMDDVAVFPST